MNEQIKNSISAFVLTLRKMFMIDDAAELDFGIYRIMAQKKAEIEAFFGLNDESDENALCRKIEKLLAEQQGASIDVKEIKKQLEDRIRMYKEDGDTMEQINKKLLLSGKTQNGKKSRPGALSTWTSGYISQK